MALATVGVRFVAEDASKFVSDVNSTIGAVNQIQRRIGLKQADTLTGQINKLGKGFQQLGVFVQTPLVPVAQLGKAITNIGTSFDVVGRRLTLLGFRLTTAFTFPILGAAKATASAAISYEESITKIITQVGLAQGAVDELSDGILSAAEDLAVLPTELADASFFITSAGIRDSAAALDVLEKSAKVASIGIGETKDVANAITSVLKAYGEENYTAAQAADVLVAAVRRGKFEVEQFAPAIGRSLGVAAELGVTFEEVSAFISTFTLSGVSASQAVTALNRTMASVLKPSKDAKEALAELGIIVNEDRNDFERLVRTQGLTATLISIRNQAERLGVPLSRIFTRLTGLSGVLFTTGSAALNFGQNLDAIVNSSGIAEKAFEEFSTTTTFQINQLKTTLQVFAIEIGNTLLPAINTVVQELRPLINGWKELVAENPKLAQQAVVIALLVAALGPLLIVGGLVANLIGTLVTGIGGLITALGGLFSILGAVKAIMLTFGALLVGSLIAGTVEADSAIVQMGNNFNTRFEQIATNSEGWGENVIVSFARGMARAIAAVVIVLIEIGKTITYWLQGLSPPRLLPDLEEWGAAAMEAYLHGWTQADFDVFNQLAGTLTGLIQNLPGIEDVDSGELTISLREDLQRLIDQFTQTGVVSEQVLSRLAQRFGELGGVVRSYVENTLALVGAQNQLADAQAEVNRITEQYTGLLKPLNKRLGEIGDRRQELSDAFRIEALEAIINDPRATPEAIELAQLELEEIRINEQIRSLEDQRDAELEVADAAVSAAEQTIAALQEQIALQESIIGFREEELGALQDLEESFTSLASPSGPIAKTGDLIKGLGKAAGEAGVDLDKVREIMSERPDEKGALFQAGERLRELVRGAQGLAERMRLREQLEREFAGIQTAIGGDGEEGGLVGTIQTGMETAFSTVLAEIETLVQSIKDEFAPLTPLFEELGQVWGEAFSEITQEDIDNMLAIAEAAIKIYFGFKLLQGTITVISVLATSLSTIKLAGLVLADIGLALGGLVALPLAKLGFDLLALGLLFKTGGLVAGLEGLLILLGPVGIAALIASVFIGIMVKKFGSLEGAIEEVGVQFGEGGTFGKGGIVRQGLADLANEWINTRFPGMMAAIGAFDKGSNNIVRAWWLAQVGPGGYFTTFAIRAETLLTGWSTKIAVGPQSVFGQFLISANKIFNQFLIDTVTGEFSTLAQWKQGAIDIFDAWYLDLKENWFKKVTDALVPDFLKLGYDFIAGLVDGIWDFNLTKELINYILDAIAGFREFFGLGGGGGGGGGGSGAGDDDGTIPGEPSVPDDYLPPSVGDPDADDDLDTGEPGKFPKGAASVLNTTIPRFSAAVDRLTSALDSPFSSFRQQALPVSAAQPVVAGPQQSVNIGPISANNGMDAALLVGLIERAVVSSV